MRTPTSIAALALALAAAILGAPTAVADPPYSSCADARADGASNIQQGEEGYSSKLDRDGDGVACESG